MAAGKLAEIAFVFYAYAAGTFLLEILQFFISPDNLGSLVAVTVALVSYFEIVAFLNIYFYITFIIIKALIYVSSRILFHFRPALHEKVKERLRKSRDAWKLKKEAEQKPSTLTCFFYLILWSLMMIVNGLIFLREEGTPFIEGALQRFVTVAPTFLYAYIFNLIAFSIFFVLVGIVVSIFRSYRSRTVETPAAIEEGRSEEVSGVQGGIYSTAANYIQASIFDEKLVDLDEPVPKLVDIDEPALVVKVVDEEALRLSTVGSTPVELL